MTVKQLTTFATAASIIAISTVSAISGSASHSASDEVIAKQRANLARNTEGLGFGPQSPRDLDTATGKNTRSFATAPTYAEMNLCNIHFHENAEHKGGEFTTYAGNGDGKGYGTGFKYDGVLTEAELTPAKMEYGDKGHGGLIPGDTIETHFVHTTALVKPGPTLGSCLSPSIGNPQLRVETVVMVLVNDESAANFIEIAEVGNIDGYAQAVNLPNYLGDAVQYDGSTTGPGYNEKGSPFQVSWSVRPKVLKVNIETVGAWLEDNIFDEDHAHGVRNLIVNPDLISTIGK
ncbi:delta-class carbonic anhydrase [Lentilitoribacter sp. Alg239-R112]|uniref:delta-class carbonic anhydrase n=1 Tax=Lentilitoribacter sp. Alg239-R112 TaxID=2305987 RepID=UPI0013A6FB6A|nr:delta-class carbonic anhydrase [Lentilitoribacter sp. Alg239-R112]